jgi:predicted DNA-binding transcriptional regulator AlpA
MTCRDIHPRSAREVLSEAEAAAELGVDRSTLRKARVRSAPVPPHYRLGSRVFYPRADLEGWIERQLRANTTEAA